MNNYLMSVKITQKANETYQMVNEILSKGGLELTKRIKSYVEVNSKIPETEWSTKFVKSFKTEPQSSSIFELNWSVGTDSTIFCLGTEQQKQLQQKQLTELSYRFSQECSTHLVYVHPSPYACGFDSKPFERRLDKHGTQRRQHTTKNCSLIGALIWQK